MFTAFDLGFHAGLAAVYGCRETQPSWADVCVWLDGFQAGELAAYRFTADVSVPF